MRAHIINLDTATDRWKAIEESFTSTGLVLNRVPAINGADRTFSDKDYSEVSYLRFHGRTTNTREIGCYLSHLKAMEAFLETNDSHAFIGEDDIVLRPNFEACLTEALSYSAHWNVLRVTGLSQGKPAKVADLANGYSLYVGFGRLKGAGGYVLDRAAARAFVDGLLPMWLPYDHAVDREWFFGLSAAYVLPFPASQTQELFRSSIQKGKGRMLSSWSRSLTTYPYQAFNEVSRWLFRSFQYLRLRFATTPL